MKKLRLTLSFLGMLIFPALIVSAQDGTKEYEIIKQLSTQSVVAALPVANFLNAPGNEKLKSFFFDTGKG